jgi:hypothetical protein
MLKIVQIVLLVCTFQFCFAWEKQYSTGDIWRIIENEDSNLYFIAMDATYNSLLYSVSSIGDSNWCFYYEYPEFSFSGLVSIEDYSIYFTGSDIDNGYLVRYFASGEYLWSHIYPSPFPVNNSYVTDIDKTFEEDYLLVGAVGNIGGEQYKPWLLKIDNSGDTLWNKMLDYEHGFFRKVIVRDDGQIGTFGFLENISFFALFDETGDSIHFYEFSLPWTVPELWIYDFGLCADNGFCCVGEVYSGAFYEQEIFIARIDADGTPRWQKTIPIPLRSVGVGIFEHPDKGFIVFGYNRGFCGDSLKPIMIKLDSLGDTLWTRVYPEDTFYVGSAIKCRNGDYVLAGSKKIGEYYTKIFCVSTLSATPFQSIKSSRKLFPSASNYRFHQIRSIRRAR